MLLPIEREQVLCYVLSTGLLLTFSVGVCVRFQQNIDIILPAKLDHFYLFDPCRAKNLTSDLSFNNYETVRRRVVDMSNYTFSESL